MSQSITVVGAANVDIIATPILPYRPCDSNPSRVEIGFGGVGRNIAHNLSLLGEQVDFVTAFGDDQISTALLDDCRSIGLDTSLALRCTGQRSNYFICVNDHLGEMQAGAADMELMESLTPQMIATLEAHCNGCRAVVADCNPPEDTLAQLARRCTVPIYVDATSSAKAAKVMAMLAAQEQGPITVKFNHAEAKVVTGLASDVEAMARWLLTRGAERVYITLGAQGVYCADKHESFLLPTHPVKVVNATGAGDAFMSGVVWAETHGLTMLEAVSKGLQAASFALQSKSAVSDRITEIKDRQHIIRN